MPADYEFNVETIRKARELTKMIAGCDFNVETNKRKEFAKL